VKRYYNLWQESTGLDIPLSCISKACESPDSYKLPGHAGDCNITMETCPRIHGANLLDGYEDISVANYAQQCDVWQEEAVRKAEADARAEAERKAEEERLRAEAEWKAEKEAKEAHLAEVERQAKLANDQLVVAQEAAARAEANLQAITNAANAAIAEVEAKANELRELQQQDKDLFNAEYEQKLQAAEAMLEDAFRRAAEYEKQKEQAQSETAEAFLVRDRAQKHADELHIILVDARQRVWEMNRDRYIMMFVVFLLLVIAAVLASRYYNKKTNDQQSSADQGPADSTS
jgi:hypothetical protein